MEEQEKMGAGEGGVVGRPEEGAASREGPGRRAKEGTAGRGTGSGKFVRQERVLMLLDVNESPK